MRISLRSVKGTGWLIGFHARDFDRSVTGAFDFGHRFEDK
jgi:hypothetical protein